MHSLAHRARQRRRERTVLAGTAHLNLVPLVDILTSIVFFSLLTYRGELLAALTAYDLSLPPAVVRAPAVAPATPEPEPRLTVRIDADALRLDVGGRASGEIAGVRGPALQALAARLTELRQQYAALQEVVVVPADAVAYDDVVHVLEALRTAGYRSIALGGAAAGAAAGAPPATTP